MSVDMSQFYQTFFDESFEGLDIMESGLLGLDIGAADAETINTVFRAAHSIKGGSATFGFTVVAEFTHLMETLLDEMRDGTRMVTEDSVDYLLKSVDCLKELLTAVQNEAEYNEDFVNEVKAGLERLLHGDNESPVGASSEGELDNKSGGSVVEGWIIDFKPAEYLLKTGNDPVRLINELSLLGKIETTCITDNLPIFSELDPETIYLSWRIKLEGDVPKEKVTEVFEWVDDDADLTFSCIGGEPEQEVVEEAVDDISNTNVNEPGIPDESGEMQQSASAPLASAPVKQVNTESKDKADTAKKAAPAKSAKDQSSIRVSIDKVDDLINMVGELVITQSMLGQLGENVNAESIEKLQDGLAQLERNTRELQESVMRIRMLPISFAFQRFPRMVRDLSNQLGKEIELKLLGEQTELDKTVMEKIGDPLVHLVRNSVDHGIETPDEREANGKPRMGTVELNAYHQGGNIIIEISDDGKGIDKDVIFNKAVEKGVVNANDSLTDEQIYDLIFAPGFSTAAVVSDVSGRGVGMDVVKRNIRELGGTIEVRSEKGAGSVIVIRLPLTLAILDGQLVRVGKDTYIIPLISIIESLQVKKNQINSIGGQAELYKLRDEYVPVVRLYETFGLKPDSEELADGLIVIVEGDGSTAGLFVDDLLGQQQVVIKSLETNFRPVEGISGATILGDGTVALILDVSGLINLSRQSRERAA
ncbi:MAG: chemotaxis protein CheA [Gammaproteobacteria bacterium]|nr:chemotaxis protein CheA [Gammaproteobacteria bacterium]